MRPRALWEAVFDHEVVQMFLLPSAAGYAVVLHRNGRLVDVVEFGCERDAAGYASRVLRWFRREGGHERLQFALGGVPHHIANLGAKRRK